jgi:cobyrinic acid a,c-diamide synthase
MAHLFISAAHKSSGKTTVSLGLCRALSQRQLHVQAFKKGPDYIDPIWHGLACGRPSYNLDFHMMREDEIQNLFARHAPQADINVIEGNKGLYDGMDVDGADSNAALAKLLQAPVVLVLDTQGMTRGVAPLILGYQAFDRDVNIAGVILNKVGGARHESKLRSVIERYTDVKVLGSVRIDERLAIVERHLGLMPGNESEEAEGRINTIAQSVAEQVDLESVMALAATAPSSMHVERESNKTTSIATINTSTPSETRSLRLAYLHDRAFGFYYQEDIDTLRDAGVEMLPVDALKDGALPDCDGLLIGGGFPEVFAEELEANAGIRNDIRCAIDAGLPTYAECGGLMYLSRSLRWKDSRHEMVGVVPGDVVMGSRPVGRGYAVLEDTTAALWPAQNTSIPAHEFHYSHLENLPTDLTYAYRVTRGHGIEAGRDGYVYKQLLASYCHRRGSGPQGWIAPFLDTVRAFRASRQRQQGAAQYVMTDSTRRAA